MQRQVITEDELRSTIYTEFLKHGLRILTIRGGLQKHSSSSDRCNWHINWDENIEKPTDQEQSRYDEAINTLRVRYNVGR